MVTIRCAHGETVLYPLAKVDLVVEGLPVEVEVAMPETLPVPVLIQTDVPEFTWRTKYNYRANQAGCTCNTTQAQADPTATSEAQLTSNSTVPNLSDCEGMKYGKKKMVETTRVRVAVLESQYVNLGDLGVPLSVCLQLQQLGLQLHEAQ